MALTETEFQELASSELEALLRAIDELGDVEVDLGGDILVIEFDDDSQCVINTQTPARQIWMSAQRRAWHFDWAPEEERWVAGKTGEELWSVVSESLTTQAGRAVKLSR